MSNSRLEKIRERLSQALNPSSLEVIDESAQHYGHAGSASGQGHYAIVISSDKFQNKSRIDCHRMIYDALGSLMQTDIHALKIKIV